jgi:regulator of chromosome condensation (RCC1) repeat-containing protein
VGTSTNFFGQLGLGNTTDRSNPTQISNFTARPVVTGPSAYHTLASNRCEETTFTNRVDEPCPSAITSQRITDSSFAP